MLLKTLAATGHLADRNIECGIPRWSGWRLAKPFMREERAFRSVFHFQRLSGIQ